MDQVPKILKPMVTDWTLGGFIVSFKVWDRCCIRITLLIPHKLETDQSLIIPKARQALERYGHQVVIGNDLHHRKYRVVLVSPTKPSPGENAQPDGPLLPQYEESCIEISSSPSVPPKEIEEEIVKELVRRHDEWISRR